MRRSDPLEAPARELAMAAWTPFRDVARTALRDAAMAGPGESDPFKD